MRSLTTELFQATQHGKRIKIIKILNIFINLVENSLTLCMNTVVLAKATRSFLSRAISCNTPKATEYKASVGQFENQSMVVQLTNEGNMRQRRRNASPTGLIESTTCRLLRTRLMKNL